MWIYTTHANYYYYSLVHPMFQMPSDFGLNMRSWRTSLDLLLQSPQQCGIVCYFEGGSIALLRKEVTRKTPISAFLCLFSFSRPAMVVIKIMKYNWKRAACHLGVAVDSNCLCSCVAYAASASVCCCRRKRSRLSSASNCICNFRAISSSSDSCC